MSVIATDPWINWHRTVTQTVHRYENLRNSPDSISTVAGYNETRRRIQGLIREARDGNLSLRAAGGGWSFTPVAATSGIMVGTQRLNYRFNLTQSHLARTYEPGKLPVFVQCGMSIADLNKYLASRNQALRTSGASNGQTIAGALGTGTHGAAVRVGAIADYVVAMHIATSPDKTVWLERSDYPVLKQEFIDLFQAERKSEPGLLEAALVSFGSFGFVLGVVVEPDPLYYLNAWRQKFPLSDAVWTQLRERRFDELNLPGAHGRPVHHLEFLQSPNGTRGPLVTAMFKTLQRPAGSRSPSSGGFGTGDSALDVVGAITDKWDGSVKVAAKLFDLAYPLYENLAGTPGEIFKDTSTRGRGRSCAMGLPTDRAEVAFHLALESVRAHEAPAFVSMRFVKATRATLAMNLFEPVTCVLELDGCYSTRTKDAQQDLWRQLDDSSIPYTFHWGKMNNLGSANVDRRFGADRVEQWRAARRTLLAPDERRVFSNAFTDQLELSR